VKIALPTHWTLRAIAEPAALTTGFPIVGRDTPAQVPGCVHTDLLAAGLIPDPYLADHEDRLRWIGHTDWQYTTTFSAKVVEADERVDLVFEGLDTMARIELNGRELARTKNMHRSYRFDVKDFLLAGDNVIAVTFDAPWKPQRRQPKSLGPARTPTIIPSIPFGKWPATTAGTGVRNLSRQVSGSRCSWIDGGMCGSPEFDHLSP
jgi:beta-mannosidase